MRIKQILARAIEIQKENWRQPTGDQLAQLVKCRTTVREVVDQTPANQHSGSLNNWGESAAFVTDICKWLEFLVYSDKDDKP